MKEVKKIERIAPLVALAGMMCMAMGEAAGVAVQWLVRGEAVNIAELRRQLKARGCRVDKADLPVVRPRQDP